MRFLNNRFIKRDEANADGNPSDKASTQTPEEIAAAKAIADKAEADKVVADKAKADKDKELADAPDKSLELDTTEPAKVDYGTPAEKQVANMLESAGLKPADVLTAIEANNGIVTPEIYKAIADKHGDGMASLIVGQMSATQLEAKNKTQKANVEIFNQVKEAFAGITEQSGEATWGELSTWAKENLPVKERTEFNALIKQGGMAAKLAVQELTTAFKNSEGFTQDAVLLDGDNTPNASTTSSVTQREYNEQLRELLDKGHNYDTSPEIKRLQNRRIKSAQRNV